MKTDEVSVLRKNAMAAGTTDLVEMEARITQALEADLALPAHDTVRMTDAMRGYATLAEERLKRREKELELKVTDLRDGEHTRRGLREEEIRAIRADLDRDREDTAKAVSAEEARARTDIDALRRNITASRAFLMAADAFGAGPAGEKSAGPA